MKFNAYYSAKYSNPMFDKYLYEFKSVQYSPPTNLQSDKTNELSLDDILLQVSTALLDKLVNTAFTITYRLKIYNSINNALDSQWNEVRSEISNLSGFYPGSNINIERRKSMLSKELLGIERLLLEQKVQCWKDLSYPTNYFVDLFHKHLEQKADQRILRS